MLKQRENAVASGNTAKITQINALLASNGVVAAPAPAPASAARNLNLSNFTPAQHENLLAVVASMKPRPQTELELSYNALKKAESTGKKRSRRTRKTKRRTTRRK